MPDNLLARIGVLTISDRASAGEYEDISGKAINDFLERALQSNWVAVVRIVPDGADSVAQALIDMVEREGCDLILTTGGTGPAPRDLTNGHHTRTGRLWRANAPDQPRTGTDRYPFAADRWN